MRTHRRGILLILTSQFVLLTNLAFSQEKSKPIQPAEAIRTAVRKLVTMQEPATGLWPYVGRWGRSGSCCVASTAIVAESLLLAAPHDKAAQAAVQRALAAILDSMNSPAMAPKFGDNVPEGANVPIWGHAFALEFLCQVRACKAAGKYEKEIAESIPRLLQALLKERNSDGGWHYEFHRVGHSSAFVTAPTAQAILFAQAQGEKVSDELLASCRKRLESDRLESGAYTYSGDADPVEFEPLRRRTFNSLAGSVARCPLCETTLFLLGAGSIDAVRFAVDNFFTHWNALEKTRKSKTHHCGPFGIAPYYVYFGHRYTAQAIQLLPEKERAKHRERLLKLILQTRDDDDTWNDMPLETCACDASYGTAMVVLALLGDKTPLPPKSKKK